MKADHASKKIEIMTRDGVRYADRGDVIHFPGGLPGFEEFTDFVVFDIDNCPPFKSMLSVESDGPDFVVVEPTALFSDYSSAVTEEITGQSAGGNEYVNLVVLSIVTIGESPENSTINLRGPILVDPATRNAQQIILTNDEYTTRMPLV